MLVIHCDYPPICSVERLDIMRILTRLLSNKKGFTLIELIVATAILGLLAELFATIVMNQMPRYRLNSATRQVAWDLMGARMKAITEYTDLKVIFPTKHQYTVWSDTDNDNVVDADETVLVLGNLRPKYHDVSFAEPLPATFTFSIRGTSSMAQDMTLINGDETRTIRISIAGKVNVN